MTISMASGEEASPRAPPSRIRQEEGILDDLLSQRHDEDLRRRPGERCRLASKSPRSRTTGHRFSRWRPTAAPGSICYARDGHLVLSRDSPIWSAAVGRRCFSTAECRPPQLSTDRCCDEPAGQEPRRGGRGGGGYDEGGEMRRRHVGKRWRRGELPFFSL